MKNLILLIALVTLTSSCASVQSVSLTSIPADRHQPVQTEVSKLIIFGFNFDNDFINDLSPKLEKQCPEGKVAGILTKDESINYFIGLVYKRNISAKGYCIKEETVYSVTNPGEKP